MSGWRRTALELFPGDASKIAVEDSIGVAFLLNDKLVNSLQSGEYTTARNVVKFALWLLAHAKHEDAFAWRLRDILDETIKRAPIRSEFWKVVSADEFLQLAPVFSEILQRDAFSDLEREHRFTIR